MPRFLAASAATAALLLLSAAQPAPAQPAPLRGLDAYVERAMRDWEVPGLAIAVVRNDSVVFARGYGVRELGGSERVDEHTLFAIASTTKAMTAAALGMLVDEGKLHWDDPVSRHLPGFELQDAFVSRELSVRDLLSHRSGVARMDQLWIASPFDRAELLRRARYLPASTGFRTQYGYHNVMYVAAGEVVGAAAGRSWDDFLDERLFRPLGMTRSTTRAAVVGTRDNVSASHTRVDGRVAAVARRNYDPLGAAGSVFSSSWEMAQWIRLHLGGGSYRGARLLSDSTLRELHTPQTVIRIDSVAERLFPNTHFGAYGLGRRLQDYHGRKLVHHSGSVNWTRTQVGMLPAEGVGVVVIANLSSSDLQTALMYRVLDAYLGLPARDWSAEYLALSRRATEREAAAARDVEAARVAGTRPSLAVERYAGTYDSPVFGELRLAHEEERLVLRYSPDYVADLEHWHHNTFRATWRRAGFGRAFVNFTLDARGRVGGLQLDGFGDFRRTADAPAVAAVLLTAGTAVAQAPALPADAESAEARLRGSPRHGEWAMIPAGAADSVRAWVVYPERADAAPVVLVVHEIYGLTHWVRAVADQLAADGFVAIAPDLLSGKGVAADAGGEPDREAAVREVRALDADEVHRRLGAIAAWGAALPSTTGRYGIVGFCWGGTVAFVHATRAPALGASVVYYGSSPDAAALQRTGAPVLGLYGADDARVNATIAPADSALRALGRTFEPRLYDGAGHGFLRQQGGRDGANLRASQAAWPATLEWFRRHLEPAR